MRELGTRTHAERPKNGQAWRIRADGTVILLYPLSTKELDEFIEWFVGEHGYHPFEGPVDE